MLTVVDHDVKLFQGANQGSSPIDISARVPDDSGFHTLSAFESSDPPQVDSGSGVLARVTLEATAEGESELAIGERDINNDGTLDRGTLMRDIDAVVIGDTDEDNYFDGEASGAIVVVGDAALPATTSPLLDPVIPEAVSPGCMRPWEQSSA